MYERFTDRARKVIKLANEEAQRFSHEYIGTEHILLGIVKEGEGVAAHVLKSLDIDLRKIRLEIEKIVQSGPDTVTHGRLPPTPRAKKVIEYAIDEARSLGHNYVGTEHLLLGLLREDEGVAAQILMNLGLRLEDVREETLNLLGHDVATSRDKPGLPSIGDEEKRLAALRDLLPRLFDLPRAFRNLLELALPAVRELDDRIQQLTLGKERAIAERDFEKAARLRDQAVALQKQRETLIREWQEKLAEPSSWDVDGMTNP